MRNKHLVFIVLIVILSCGKSNKEVNIVQEPLMYEPTEMALLMRSMYEFNKATKMQIVNNDSLLPFPEEFLTIHTAMLTDPDERTKEFDSLSTQFLQAQKATFSSKSDSTKYHFNRSINLCVSCHETRCVGPIPMIKKLRIN